MIGDDSCPPPVDRHGPAYNQRHVRIARLGLAVRPDQVDLVERHFWPSTSLTPEFAKRQTLGRSNHEGNRPDGPSSAPVRASRRPRAGVDGDWTAVPARSPSTGAARRGKAPDSE